MSLSTITVEPLGTENAPAGWTLSGAQAIGIQTISAFFDGTGASGSFVPCCTFKAPDGRVIARCPTDATLSVGDKAEVTFAPFLRGQSSSAPFAGIVFDADNTGTWFNLVTTGRDVATLDGIHIEAQGFPLTIETTPEGGFNSLLYIHAQGNGLTLLLDSTVSSTPLFIDTAQGQLISIGGTEPASGNINIGNDPATVGNGVGFFLTPPVSQQTLPAVPTTAQIRAVLVAFGLVAP